MPKNKILVFTLVGAVLTGVIAVGLAYPGIVPSPAEDENGSEPSVEGGSVEAATEAPAPNQNFTPQVMDRGYEEHEEYEEYYEEEHEEDDEYDEQEEYEEEYEDEGEYENDEEENEEEYEYE